MVWAIAFIIFLLILIMVIINIYEGKSKKHTHIRRTGHFTKLSYYEGNFLINSIKGKLNIMALSMTDTQQASGVLSFVDKKGSPTDVPDGNVKITSSDESIASVTYDDPTNTVTVVAGKAGVAALTIVATNKAGQQLPFDDVAVEITAGDASTGTITFGEPTEQP